MAPLGVYQWCVKMPRCGCVEHILTYFSFYVKKHIAHLAACSGPSAGPLAAIAILKLAYSNGTLAKPRGIDELLLLTWIFSIFPVVRNEFVDISTNDLDI